MAKPYTHLRARMSPDAQRQAEDKAQALLAGEQRRLGQAALAPGDQHHALEQSRPRATREAGNFSC